MKNIVMIPCFLFSAILAFAGEGARENLLKNGGFEKLKPFALPSVDFDAAKPFYGWNCVGDWFNHVSVSRYAKDGNAAVFFSAPCWITRRVKVRPGARYEAAGWFRTSLRTTPSDTPFGAYFEIKAGNKTLLYGSISGIHPWTKLSGEFTVPKGIKWIQISIGLKATNGVCWADAFSVVEVHRDS